MASSGRSVSMEIETSGSSNVMPLPFFDAIHFTILSLRSMSGFGVKASALRVEIFTHLVSHLQ